MVKNVTYHNPINQEENTPLVTILETRVDLKQSTAVDSRSAAYNIDLAKASFGGVSYPEPGSQWYLKKISGVWTLMARAAQQNPQLDPALDPQPGESYLGDGGTTVIVGDQKINGNLLIEGTLTLGTGSLAIVGEIRMWPTLTAPDVHWQLCDGTSLLNATYPALYTLLQPAIGVATMTIASPCVVSFTAHGLSIGDRVFFTTTGALPTGLAASTTYWVISAGFGANSFQVSTTQTGSAINTTGTQSGVHTLSRTYFGIADATHFNAPDFRGRTLIGRDASQTEFAAIGMTGGEKTHTMTSGEMVSHTHAVGTLVNAAESAHTHSFSATSSGQSADHSHLVGRDSDGGPGTTRFTVHNTGVSGAAATSPTGGASNDHTHTVSGTSGAGSSHNHTISGSTASTGSTTAFNVLQPYIPINYIIRLV